MPDHHGLGAAVTIDDITRITQEANPVLRNLWITQCYHDLCVDLSRVVAAGNANWSTFATWASKTAGISIRGQELPRVMLDVLRDEARLRPRLGPLFAWVYRHTGIDVDLFGEAHTTIQRVSEDVAEGNLKVFAELAPLFARFIDVMDAPAAEQQPRLQTFLDALRPGPSDAEGQAVLRQAFSNYAAAAGESDATVKAQLVLLANCQIGLHEQTRLQSAIKAAMDAPVATIITEGLGKQFPIWLAFVLLWPFGVRREKVRAVIRSEWECVATRFSMTLSLPDGRTLPLGGDAIPWPSQIPEPLQTLSNPELLALLATFGDDVQRLSTRGAHNWSDLRQRMGFICELFRCQQQNPALFTEAFSDAVRTDLARGIVPQGEI